MKSIKGAFGSIRRLNHIRRYSSYPVTRQENVAEHSYWVALTALAISDELDEKGIKLDKGLLLSKCLMHDIGESQAGDIVRSFKYANTNLTDNIRKTEKGLVEKFLAKEFGNTAIEMYALYNSCKHGDEGIVVSFCDFLAVLTYSVEEVCMGNNYMRDILVEAMTNAKEFDSTFMEEYAKEAIKVVKEKLGEKDGKRRFDRNRTKGH